MLLFPINPVHILIPFYFSELPSQSQIKSNFFLSFIQKLASMLQLTKKWSDYWASFFQSVLRSTAGQKLQKWTLFKNLPHTTKFFLFFFFFFWPCCAACGILVLWSGTKAGTILMSVLKMKEMHSERWNNCPKAIQLICSETETWIQSDYRICPFPLLYYITPVMATSRCFVRSKAFKRWRNLL